MRREGTGRQRPGWSGHGSAQVQARGPSYSRFRMFLLSSSSTAGLWLSRLRKNTRITLCTMVAPAKSTSRGLRGRRWLVQPSRSLPTSCRREGDLWWWPLASRSSQTSPWEGGPRCQGALGGAGEAQAPPRQGRLPMSRSAPSLTVLRVLEGRAFEPQAPRSAQERLPPPPGGREGGAPAVSPCRSCDLPGVPDTCACPSGWLLRSCSQASRAPA